jgi:hypothetical protein
MASLDGNYDGENQKFENRHSYIFVLVWRTNLNQILVAKQLGWTMTVTPSTQECCT